MLPANFTFKVLPLTLLLGLPLAAANIVPHVETHDFGGGTLRIHAGAGGLRIVHGADNQHVTVRYTAAKDGLDASSRVKLTLTSQGSDVSIDLRGPWDVKLDTVIEVPNPVSLEVRIKDGDLLIQGVDGNKTLQSRSGDITLTQPNDEYAQAYKEIQLSAKIGDIYGPQFKTVHSKLFKLGKTAELNGSGTYSLHAHVTFGDVQLLPAL
jgi:hypothetical protein